MTANCITNKQIPKQSDGPQQLESARVEYQATQEAVLHYDNFTWQVGSVLLAGVFVYWGFLLDKQPDLNRVAVGNALVTAVLSLWALYAGHNRQIYRYKLHRVHELERCLNMHQHTRFISRQGDSAVYHLSGARGNLIERSIFVVGAVGCLWLGWFAAPWERWRLWHVLMYMVSACMVLMSLFATASVSRTTDHVLESLRAESQESGSDGV